MTNIRAALLSRLVAMFPGAAIPSASIAWENKNFTPAVGTRWYRATFLPGITEAAEVFDAGRNRHVGILQIDICEPENAGDALVQAEADRLITCYKRGTVLSYNSQIVKCTRAYRLAARKDDAYYVVSVLIEYRADVPNG